MNTTEPTAPAQSDEAMRVRIAQAFPGWRAWKHARLTVFDPLNDLDAMHAVEQTLTSEQQKRYAQELFHVLDGAWRFVDKDVPDNWYRVFDNIHAPARARATAFMAVLDAQEGAR